MVETSRFVFWRWMQLAQLKGCYRATKLHGVTFSKNAPPSRQPLNVLIGQVSVCSEGCLLYRVWGVLRFCSFSNCLFVCFFVCVCRIAMKTSQRHSDCSTVSYCSLQTAQSVFGSSGMSGSVVGWVSSDVLKSLHHTETSCIWRPRYHVVSKRRDTLTKAHCVTSNKT